MIYRCSNCGFPIVMLMKSKVPYNNETFCSMDCLLGYIQTLPVLDTSVFTPFDKDRQSFRSKWEAGFWYAMKDKVQKIEYEPYIIDGYVPDFLIDDKCFIEIKGVWEQGARSKVNKFKRQGYPLVVLLEEHLNRLKIKPSEVWIWK